MLSFDLVSDLHLDMWDDKASSMLEAIEPTSDTLVIAGDLCEAINLNPEWIHILSHKYRLVLYVPGNHEFYGSSPESAREILDSRVADARGWFILDGTEFSFGLKTFTGTTLWFSNQPGNQLHAKYMSDFWVIEGFDPWVYKEHERAKKLLARTTSEVWITHHLPLWNSVHSKYAGSNLNRFFVGDISDVLQKHKRPPKVIVHGHTHESRDYMAGDIRVVCNPHGYPGEASSRIMPKRIEY